MMMMMMMMMLMLMLVVVMVMVGYVVWKGDGCHYHKCLMQVSPPSATTISRPGSEYQALAAKDSSQAWKSEALLEPCGEMTPSHRNRLHHVTGAFST